MEYLTSGYCLAFEISITVQQLTLLTHPVVFVSTKILPMRTEKKKGRGSPYLNTERRGPELIPVLGSQPARDVSPKPDSIGCHYFPPGLQLPQQPLRGLLLISSTLTTRLPSHPRTAKPIFRRKIAPRLRTSIFHDPTCTSAGS